MAKKIAKPARAAPGRLVFKRDGREVWCDDCLSWLARCEPGRFSACVTDPPYHLTQISRGGSPRKPGTGPFGRHKIGSKGFMGKTWDGGDVSFDPETWRAVLRALRPGAHLVAFGGTRTFHRIACAIEDAGWEIRDCLMWVYGSGFPKSLDVSKAIDKAAGAERERKRPQRRLQPSNAISPSGFGADGWSPQVDEPATPEAARWQGWGTGLKPSWEPIILARKPLDGTVAECVLRHGTGALNVDGCRIGTERREFKGMSQKQPTGAGTFRDDEWKPKDVTTIAHGRWPPNAVFQHDARCVRVGTEPSLGPQRAAGSPGFGSGRKDGYEKGEGRVYRSDETREVYACVPGCPVRMLDGQSGVSVSAGGFGPNSGRRGPAFPGYKGFRGANTGGLGDAGGASRFFYCPKANTSERRAGLSMLEDNLHPTVKPVALMEWLLRLVAPPGGEVLDPFAGSGSTLVAAKRLGVAAVGIDMNAEACETASARLTRRTAKGIGGAKKLKLGRRRRKR